MAAGALHNASDGFGPIIFLWLFRDSYNNGYCWCKKKIPQVETSQKRCERHGRDLLGCFI